MHNVHSVCLFTVWKRPAPSVYVCKDKHAEVIPVSDYCTMDSNMVGTELLELVN